MFCFGIFHIGGGAYGDSSRYHEKNGPVKQMLNWIFQTGGGGFLEIFLVIMKKWAGKENAKSDFPNWGRGLWRYF